MGINFKTLAAAKTYTKKSVDGLGSIQGQPGKDGKDGVTPHIDNTSKHWMIGSDDTGILAEGIQGKTGKDGTTPHIGDNGNWWFGNTDSGIPIPSVEDLLTYADENNGISDTPVGHIISVMSNSAPSHYLICDGTEYNISDYPYLADHFTDEFGQANYFGGDGITTFAVPDLRGEFIRGSGTAKRNTGSGAEVGIHQEPTKQISIGYNTNVPSLWLDSSLLENGVTTAAARNQDTAVRTNSTVGREIKLTNWNGAAGYSQFTARPTNTSVLFCIKYEPTYFIKNTYDGNSVYSTEETAVGKWINGSNIYRKVIESKIESETVRINHGIENLDFFISIKGFAMNENYYAELPITSDTMSYLTKVNYKSSFDQIEIYNTNPNFADAKIYIIIEYTKTSDAAN